MTLLQPLIIVQFCGICLPKRIKTLLLLKVRFQGEERLCGENLVVGGGSDRCGKVGVDCFEEVS